MDEIVRAMIDAFDDWAANIIRLYDRNGRPLKWSEMRLLKWGPSDYETVRRHTVRGNILVTTWMPYAREGNYGVEFFQTYLAHDGVGVVVGHASTEMQAIERHYEALEKLLADIDAPLSEVRGWLEISAPPEDERSPH